MSTEIVSPSLRNASTQFAHTAATVRRQPFVNNAKAWLPADTNLADVAGAHYFTAEITGAPKATGEAWVNGSLLYWHPTNLNFTTTSTGATKAGYALEAATSGATTGGLVLFNTFAQ